MKIIALMLSLLVLSLLPYGSVSTSAEGGQFDVTCTGADDFYYDRHLSYDYSYQTIVQNYFHTDPDDHQQTQMMIDIRFSVDSLNSCTNVLNIQSARLLNENQGDFDTDEWERDLMRDPLLFRRRNGIITSVRASSSEPTWVLNIKRGILSMMSVSTSQIPPVSKENDVFGECPLISHDVSQVERTTVVTKEKNLGLCKNLKQPFTSFFATLISGNEQTIVEQKQKCSQTISNFIINSAQCREEHVMRPFSSEEEGARTVVDQQLRFISSRTNRNLVADIPEDGITKDLSFEDEESTSNDRDISEIQNLYTKICMTLDKETFEEVSQDYVKMIFLLRRLDASAISQAQSSLEGACPAWEDSLKSMFMDALKWCGSEGCVEYGATLIAAGSPLFDDDTSRQWLMSMNLIKKPTLLMIESITTVVESRRFSEQASLVVGSMIHGYCSQNEDCTRKYAVRKALNMFESNLISNCLTSSDEERDQVLLALRALGNAGQLQVADTLTTCALEAANTAEVRVAAMNAFRRMTCNSDKSLERIVFDRDVDSEVRIAAYMQMINCPTSSFVSNVVKMLDDEPSQQTASFISTHLRSVLVSKDPLKGYLKPYLVEVELAKVYDLDPRKYSRYYEASYYSDRLDSGITGEASIIWSPRSFVPRSAAADLTANVFGKTVNLFEIGGRVEGVEQLLQDLMQTKQFLQDTGIGKIFGADDLIDDDDEEVETDLPKKSKVPNPAKRKAISKKYQKTIKEESMGLSYFFRMLGNEISYSESHPSQVTEDLTSKISSFFDAIARGKDLTYHKNMPIATWAFTVATGAGLPLTIAVNGSVSLDVQAGGQMDFSNLLSSNPEFSISAQFNPRATVVINGAMSVDAHASKSGLMTESSMMSGWKISGTASMLGGRKVSLRIDTPYQENSLFRFRHKLMKLAGNRKLMMTSSDQVISETACSEELFGHAFCITSPIDQFSLFPAKGEILYSANIQKQDTGLTHLLFDASYSIDYDDLIVPPQASVDIVFDTPGSSINRRSTFLISYNRNEGRLRATMTSPESSSELEGRTSFSSSGVQVLFDITTDGRQQSLQLGIEREMSAESRSFNFSCLFNSDETSNRFITSFSYTPMKMISFQLLSNDAINLNFHLNNGSSKSKLMYDGQAVVFIDQLFNQQLKFDTMIKPKLDNFAATINYQLNEGEKENIRISHKHSRSETQNQLSSEQKILISQMPDYNFVSTFDYLNEESIVKTSAHLSYGEDATQDYNQKTITFRQSYNTEGSSPDRTVIRSGFQLIIPRSANPQTSVEFTCIIEPLSTEVAMSYQDENFFRYFNQRQAGDRYENRFEILTPTPWGITSVNGRLRETDDSVYLFTSDFTFGRSNDMRMTASIELTNAEQRKGLDAKVSQRGTTDNMLFHLRTMNSYGQGEGFSFNYFLMPGMQPMTLNFSLNTGDRISADAYVDVPSLFLDISFNGSRSDNSYAAKFRCGSSEASAQEVGVQFSYTQSPNPAASLILNTDVSGLPLTRISTAFQLTPMQLTISSTASENDNELLSVLLNLGKESSNGEISQNLFSEISSEISFMFVYTKLKQRITVNMGSERFELTSKLISYRMATLNLDHSLRCLDDYNIPRQLQLDTELLTHENDGRVGFVARLNDDRTEAKLEAYYENNANLHILDATFQPGSFEIFHPLDDMKFSSKMRLGGKFSASVDQNILIGNDEKERFWFKLDSDGLNFNMYQRLITPMSYRIFFPSDFNGNIMWGDEKMFDTSIVLDGRRTELRGELILSPALLKIYFTSEEPTIRGEYQLKLMLDKETGSHIFVQAQEKSLFANLNWSLENLYLNASFQQNFFIDRRQLIPYNVRLTTQQYTLSNGNFVFETNVAYNDLRVFYNHEVARNLLDFDILYTLKQNIFSRANHVRGTGNFTLSIGNVSRVQMLLDIMTIIDDDDERSLSFSILKSDNPRLIVQIAAAQDIAELKRYPKYLPREFTFEFTFDNVSIGINTESKGSYPTHLRSELRIVEDTALENQALNFSIDFSDMRVADYFNYDRFDFITSVKCASGRIETDFTFNNNDKGSYRFSELITFKSSDSSTYVITTDTETNCFRKWGLEFGWLERVQTNSIVVLAVQSLSQISVSAKTQVESKAFVDGGYESLTNNFDFYVEAALFQYRLQLSANHDFEIGFPRTVSLLISGSKSEKAARMFHTSGQLLLTRDDLKESASFVIHYNPDGVALDFSLNQNFTLVLENGVPGVFSISFDGKSLTDFDLTIKNDNMRRNIGFTFNYLGDDKKLILSIYHDFEYLREQYSIPMLAGFECQALPGKDDITFNLRFYIDENVRTANSLMRWELEGEGLMALRSFDFRYQQNFTAKYIPEKVRFSLSRYETNYDIVVSANDKDARLKVNLENTDEESIWEVQLSQTFVKSRRRSSKAFPKRVLVAFRIYYLDNASSLRVKINSRTKLAVSAQYEHNAEAGTIQANGEIEQSFTSKIPEDITVIVGGNYSKQDFEVGVSVSQNGESPVEASLNGGFNPRDKTFFTSFNHNMATFSIPQDSRLDGQILPGPGSVDLSLQVMRDTTENSVQISSNWQLTDDSFYASANLNHDLEELEQWPRAFGTRFFFSVSNQQVTIDLNATADEEVFSHNAQLSYQNNNNIFKYMLIVSQANRFLIDLEVPQSVGGGISMMITDNSLISELLVKYIDSSCSLLTSITINGDTQSNDYAIKFINNLSGSLNRDDHVGLRLYLNPINPMLEARLQISELSAMGIPRDYSIELLQNNAELFDWSAQASADNQQIHSRIQMRLVKSESFFISTSLNHNIFILLRNQVPRNMSANYDYKWITDARNQNVIFEENSAIRYDDKFVSVSSIDEINYNLWDNAHFSSSMKINSNFDMIPSSINSVVNCSFTDKLFKASILYDQEDLSMFVFDVVLNVITANLDVSFRYKDEQLLTLVLDGQPIRRRYQTEVEVLRVEGELLGQTVLLLLSTDHEGQNNRFKLNGQYGVRELSTRISYPSEYSFSFTSNEIKYMPEKILFDYSPTTKELDAKLLYEGIQLIEVSQNGGLMTFNVKDLQGTVLAAITGTSGGDRDFSANFDIIVPQLDINDKLKMDFCFFNHVGNTTFNSSWLRTESNNQAALQINAQLKNDRATDILMTVDFNSNIAYPINVHFTSNSTFSKAQGAEYLNFGGSFNGIGFDLDSVFSSNNLYLIVNVDSVRFGAVTENKVNRNSFSEKASVMWGDEDQRLDLELKYRRRNFITSGQIIVTQPSGLFNVKNVGASFKVDSSSPTVSLKVDGNVDNYQMQNVLSYNGTYPRLYGYHEMKFESKYDLPNGDRYTPFTNIEIKIEDNSLKSSVIVQNNNKLLFNFNEEYSRVSSNNYILEVTMKQSVFSMIPLSYISLTGSLESGQTIRSRAQLQVNNLPETNLLLMINRDTSNTSFDISLSSGALSRYLYFRTLSINGWQVSDPSFFYKVVFDGKEYLIKLITEDKTNGNTNKRSVDFTFNHPHRLELFGRTLPRSHYIYLEELNRRKGTRNVMKYENDIMANPLKITSTFRQNSNRNTIIEGDVKIESTDNEDADLEIDYSITQGGSDYRKMFSIDVKSNMMSSDMALTIKTIKNEDTCGVDITLVASGETYRLRTVVDNSRSEKTYEILLQQAGEDVLSLSGTYEELKAQLSHLIKGLMADDSSSRISFIRGVDMNENSADMFIGVEVDSHQYSIHLTASYIEFIPMVCIHLEKDGERQGEVARISAEVVSGRQIKLKAAANPILSQFIKNSITIVHSTIHEQLDMLSDSVVDMLNLLISQLSGRSSMQVEVKNFIKKMILKVRESRNFGLQIIDQASRTVNEALRSSENIVQAGIRAKLEELLNKVNSLNAYLLQPFVEILKEFHVNLVNDVQTFTKSNLVPLKSYLDIVNLGDLFEDLVDEAIANSLDFIIVNADNVILAFQHPVSQFIIITDSEIILTIPLKLNLENLNDISSLEDLKEYFTKTSFFQKLEDSLQLTSSVQDYYYIAKAMYNMPSENKFPPFKGYAFIADFKHFQTFDNHYFDFASNCESSHIVVMDGRNDNFTVTLTYGEDPTYDVRVGNDVVSFSSDASTTYNGNAVNLPIVTSSGLVTFQQGNSIKTSLNDEFTIYFDTKSKLLSIEISPFYFAATGGLLGKFDNEPYFDFISPTGEKIDDVTSFAYAWEISDNSCSHENTYTRESINSEAQERCEQLYLSPDSEFRSCFPVISTKEFLSACSKSLDDYCKLAKAYQTTCQLSGAVVPMPAQCLTCDDTSGNDFSGGRSKSFNMKSVDVVVLVEEGSCLKTKGKVFAKFMKKFFKQITSNMNKMRKPKTGFFMVGYGGPGPLNEPHVFTMRGKQYSSKKSDVIKRLRHVTISSEGSPTDGLAAVKYASKLPFRAGAQQIFVHLLCDQCSSQSSTSAEEMTEILRSKNILYHHMSFRNIETTGKPAYGYDSERGYTKKGKKLSLSQVLRNDDVCHSLALQTNSAIWDANNMKSGDFVNVLSRHIGDNLPAVERQSCICVEDENGEAVSRCSYN